MQKKRQLSLKAMRRINMKKSSAATLAVAPTVVAAASAVIATAPGRGWKRKGRGSGATSRARKPPAAEVKAATHAFQIEGSSAESDNDEGYGDLLRKRTEMKKRRAAQELCCFKSARKSKPAPVVSCV
jgi:uncharacterized protein YfaP (DUF2135 family)